MAKDAEQFHDYNKTLNCRLWASARGKVEQSYFELCKHDFENISKELTDEFFDGMKRMFEDLGKKNNARYLDPDNFREDFLLKTRYAYFEVYAPQDERIGYSISIYMDVWFAPQVPINVSWVILDGRSVYIGEMRSIKPWKTWKTKARGNYVKSDL